MQAKWDERYRDAEVDEGRVAEVLAQNRHRLPASGLALDLACGIGANGIWLARAGLRVQAWDASAVAITRLSEYAAERALPIEAAVRDVIGQPPPPESYDVIVVSHFLARDLCPAIAAALRPCGLLFYQTFCGPGPGPSNPAFRLAPGELPRLFPTLRPLDYREEVATGEAKLIARREERSDPCRR